MWPSTTDGSPAFGRHERKVRRVLREVAQVLGHLVRTGRAVEADHVGSHGFERGDRGADLGTHEHPPGGLHRDLHHERKLAAGVGHRPPARDERGLRLEQVVDRLDQQHVGAARDQPGGLLLVVGPQRVERDRAERRQPRAGADRADDPAGPIRGAPLLGRLLGEPGRGHVHVVGLVRDAVFGEHQRKGAERGGLDRVDPDREVLGVHLADEVGSGHDEVLVAALERLAAEVVGAEILALDPGAERTVEDQDAFGQARESPT